MTKKQLYEVEIHLNGSDRDSLGLNNLPAAGISDSIRRRLFAAEGISPAEIADPEAMGAFLLPLPERLMVEIAGYAAGNGVTLEIWVRDALESQARRVRESLEIGGNHA